MALAKPHSFITLAVVRLHIDFGFSHFPLHKSKLPYQGGIAYEKGVPENGGGGGRTYVVRTQSRSLEHVGLSNT